MSKENFTNEIGKAEIQIFKTQKTDHHVKKELFVEIGKRKLKTQKTDLPDKKNFPRKSEKQKLKKTPNSRYRGANNYLST